ncbi:MAG TPA: hypothetical protein VNX26_08295 [Candidatus Acidoferrum sp.]|nr:hypothetical protein [Candidatus Acidoferrum sp.]
MSPVQYPPSATVVYHTTLNLALTSSESTDQPSAFWNTWNQFTTGAGPANIQTWQGRKLYYYRNDPNGVPGVTIIGFEACALDESTLLLNEGFTGGSVSGAGHNSGQCGSFAELLMASLAVNGIKSSFARILPINPTMNFLVKNWTPPQSNLNGPWKLCFNPAAVSDIMVPAQTGGVYCDLTSLPTLVGQNTQPPSEKIFSAHFIVKPSVSGVPTYVDPSYGVTYSSASNFESSAVFGYYDTAHPTGVTSTGSPIYTVVAPNPTVPGITITP